MVTAITRLAHQLAPKQVSAAKAEPAGSNGLELEQVHQAAWRVYDTRYAQGNSHHLLGCIEQRGDVFELMEIGDSFRWHTFSSLHEALDQAALVATDLAAHKDVGESAWLH